MIAREPWPTTQTAQFLCLSPPAWDWTKSSWEPVGHPGKRERADPVDCGRVPGCQEVLSTWLSCWDL